MTTRNSAAWFTYAEQLVYRRYGFPLWHPEPNRYGEVELGDVGFVSEGQFIRLFNAMRPAGDPLNTRGVPSGFVVLQPSEEHLFDNPTFLAKGAICTATMSCRRLGAAVADPSQSMKASFAFSCHSHCGAVAVLGGFGHQRWYISNRDFWGYIAKHHDSWYDFAESKGHILAPEAIVLVSGWLKTTEWALASVSNHGQAHDLSFSASAGSYAGASFEVSAGTDIQMSVEQRSGPVLLDADASTLPGSSTAQPAPLPCNQCLFLRYYKMKRRILGLWRGIDVTVEATDAVSPGDESVGRRGMAGSRIGRFGRGRSDLATRESQGSYSAGTLAMDVEEVPDVAFDAEAGPDILDAVLDQLLEEYPEADAAVACHDDLYSVLQLDNAPGGPDRSTIQNAIQDNETLQVQLGDTSVIGIAPAKPRLQNRPRPLPSEASASKPRRRTKCTRCMGLNVRCTSSADDPDICTRCYRAKVECSLSGRQTSRVLPNRGLLRAQLKKQDNTIEMLLQMSKQMKHAAFAPTTSPEWSALISVKDTLAYQSSPVDQAPLGNRKRARSAEEEATVFGPAENMGLGSFNNTLHRSDSNDGVEIKHEEDEGIRNLPESLADPGHISEALDATGAPVIFRTGMSDTEEVKILIEIYFNYVNASTGLLDPAVYTPGYLVSQSPFLCAVICKIASRFYTAKPGLHCQAMEQAKLATATALVDGPTNVDAVHAYILLALYPEPSASGEGDCSWIYLGVAIQMAVQLGLHQPVSTEARDEAHARAMLNGTRAWLHCFALDRTMGALYAKESIINNADLAARRSLEWAQSSPFNMRSSDAHLAFGTQQLVIVRRFNETVNGSRDSPMKAQEDLDILELAVKADGELMELWDAWSVRAREHTDADDVQSAFRASLLRLSHNHARTTVLSRGFQHAFDQRKDDQGANKMRKSIAVAMDVLTTLLDEIATPSQIILLRHAPETQIAPAVFTCVFLLKLLLLPYSVHIDDAQREQIRTRVQQVVGLLGSPDLAVDEEHGPKRYARWLQGLLDKTISKARESVLPGIES
ncbi:fungal specific transcription factor domain-containing protein [Phanerochaete sordida]|uniref:Fungal specific transcription factor domain-containing protein n=1 Tax=Phanerochaete sordida TaxID=48140 RepID=A0A9P3G548_9APHY|nr:fungal specific transcription factor domain-containing protein [Phanerochaete sordida]